MEIIKPAFFALLLVVATPLWADESTESLRQEFEAYKAASEERIQQLETREGRSPDDETSESTMESWKRAALGFEFHGYFRAGYGVNGQGDGMEAFKAPNAGAKYRLGNEAETYIEATFQQNFLSRELMEDDVDFFTKLTFAYVTPTANNNTFETTTSIREAYAAARGVWEGNKETLFWAGNRFYEHIDVHMNDFFFRDLAGFGGGVEDVLLGDELKFAAAWLGGSIDDLSSNGTPYEDDYNFNKNTIDLRLYDITAGIGKLALHTSLAQFGGDTLVDPLVAGNDIVVENSLGWAIGGILTSDLSDDLVNRISAQYGEGAADNFKTVMTAPQGVTPPTAGGLTINTDDTKRFRLTDDIVLKTGSPVSLQAAAVLEHYDNGLQAQSTIDWVSLGVRPIYHFGEYFSLAFEGGADYTNQEGGPEGVLGKFTLAPQIQSGRAHFARPVIRAFVTYAVWSDGFEGVVAPVSYGTDTQGTSFGVQMEAWW
jgi:maltoporin